ncbi:glutamate-cysteine ligase-domain-containing protein [Paraphysoderma sedebokerense]|nr:glutamate-cysteine ligase-domain-containing protein [Paraphysoderma sedebokerense]
MGLLSSGTPLPWGQAKQHADHVRKHGITQFINLYRKYRHGKKRELLWGDEVEYMVVSFDENDSSKPKNVRLSLRAYDALQELMKEELEGKKVGKNVDILWRPEFGRYMLEGTPGSPYGSSVKDLLTVEDNMEKRRLAATKVLKTNECLLSITTFPRLGSLEGEFLNPNVNMNDDPSIGHGGKHVEATRSLFIPDEAINPHPRFRTLAANIRERRGHKVSINMPIYKDVNTPSPFIESLPPSPWYPSPYTTGEAKPDHVYMDCMCFGMGCSCLQLTFQACSIDEARRLYDQLAPLTPIMMALSAGAPIFKGYLVDVDCRWDVIAGSVDDRPAEERGEKAIDESEVCQEVETEEWDTFSKTKKKVPKFRRIPKSRYDSISTYISTYKDFKKEYNDIPLVKDLDIEEKLKKEGVDDRLAQHYAHLFIRDPLVIYQELLDQDDSISSDHFENIQSTNWQTMRFKPPPPASPEIGWRVEFRSMEVQLTDFENSAYAIFVVLLTRVILSFDLTFYVPISKVDLNMKRAHRRDAVLKELFWFRKDVFIGPPTPIGTTPPMDFNYDSTPQSGDNVVNGAGGSGRQSRRSSVGTGECGEEYSERECESGRDECIEMTINEIINGKAGTFPGLIPLIESYLQAIPIDVETRCSIGNYLDFIRKRANGTYATTANWMRQFVKNHRAYNKDSRVGKEVAFDLLKECEKVTKEGRGVRVKPVVE